LSQSRHKSSYRIGLDVGGTFTDLFVLDERAGEIYQHKLPSTPGRPALAPLQGLAEVLAKAKGQGSDVAFIGVGTTVGTNALLERKGARTGLITTSGFRDLLEIARQKRPHTFDLHVSKPVPLVPRELRREATERIAYDGSIIVPLDTAGLRRELDVLRQAGVESIAICFLNAYANAVHEQSAAAIARESWPEGNVAVSSEILPEFREFERLTSTIVNAYLMPVMRGYLRQFEEEVKRMGVPQRPFVMSSGGGVVTPDVAGERPLDTLFSGPSGGVSGAVYVARIAGIENAITFDMGGTSTEACVVMNGIPQVSYTREISSLPIRAAAVDVHTVGAGGSSIAAIDAGGLLRVGPSSAGSQPGPACYALGGVEPTVTDANVVLGRLNPDYLLGGALKIDNARSRAAIEDRIARPKRLSVVEASAAILEVANANMAQAVRFVTVERGLDPRDFVLIAFGGAGPLHAAFVAREMGVAGVLVPYSPGVLCAMGVLAKDMQMDFSRTRLLICDSTDATGEGHRIYTVLEERAREAFRRNGYDPALLAFERSADARYVGQNHELVVAAPGGAFDDRTLGVVTDNFHRAHEQFYGFCSRDKTVELVTFRLRACLALARHDLLRVSLPARLNGPQPYTERAVFFDERGGYSRCPVYERSALRPADELVGPAIIEQMDATTVVPPALVARVDEHYNLLIPVNGNTDKHR
jgi:N-methylhydantoinase A